MVAALAKALDDADDKVRVQAAISLGWMPAKDAVPALLSKLADANCGERLRRRIAQALGQIGDVRAIPSLLPLLSSHDRWLRENAILSLGYLKAKEAVPTLVKYANGEDIPEHDGKYTRDEKLTVLDTRECAIRALGMIGDKSAVLYSTGIITANNVTGLSEQGPMATVEGSNYVYINDSEMTSSSSKRGILLHQSGSGDAEGKTPVCEISRSTLTTTDSSAPLCYVVNSTATLTLTDVTLNVASSHLMSVPTDSKGSGSTGTLVLKTTKDSWTYQGTVSAGSDNKVAVEVGQGVTWQLTADTNVNTLVNNGTIVTNGYTLNVSGSSSGTGTISETTGISSMMTPTADSSAVRYTLDGRRALSTHKGIIIQNGQKHVSK